ncbi:MAG: hypothetical protein QF893_21675 [Alphaproteobacteria bacterium]|jgi:hypothetical protein|nr:hypothetical protein [Alphaproteobacteria bacterium]
MDVEGFRATLDEEAPPADLSLALQALWQEAKGEWDAAHKLAQAQDDAVGAWVHAYLHRVEGDESNAGYWYRRAGKPHSTAPLAEEWQEIASALL